MDVTRGCGCRPCIAFWSSDAGREADQDIEALKNGMNPFSTR